MPVLHIIGLIFALAMLAGFGVLLYCIGKRSRFYCQRCDAMVEGASDLAPDDRDRVMNHFRRVEGRVPDMEKVYVCPNCRCVYDDFSAENWQRDQDVFAWDTFCKSCGSRMWTRRTPEQRIWCRHCRAGHEWRKDEEAGAVFLTRMDGEFVDAQPPGFWDVY